MMVVGELCVPTQMQSIRTGSGESVRMYVCLLYVYSSLCKTDYPDVGRWTWSGQEGWWRLGVKEQVGNSTTTFELYQSAGEQRRGVKAVQ